MIRNVSFKGSISLYAEKYQHARGSYDKDKKVTICTSNIRNIARDGASTIILTDSRPSERFVMDRYRIDHGGIFQPEVHERIISAYTAASQNPYINIDV